MQAGGCRDLIIEPVGWCFPMLLQACRLTLKPVPTADPQTCLCQNIALSHMPCFGVLRNHEACSWLKSQESA
jgi:hypothetical protein